MANTVADGCGRQHNALSAVFCGEHSWCHEKIRRREELEDSVPLLDFLESNQFNDTLHLHQCRFGRCDPRAAASFWSLFYFSTLAIPYIIAAGKGFRLPVSAEAMSIKIGNSGLPITFGISGVLDQLNETGPLDWASFLISDHLALVVSRLSDVAGISPKLSWNNAAVYIDYALRTGVSSAPRERCQTFDGMVFCERQLPNGNANPFFGCLKFEEAEDAPICRRKICCLRYMLPGVNSCGSLCAKPEMRDKCLES
jgi:ferric iron reductase protein FhuF